VIDWDHYVPVVHLPSVVVHARVRTTPGRSVVENRPDRARRAILAPSGTWRRSTSSTRSSPRTWSTPTPGWPADTSVPPSAPARRRAPARRPLAARARPRDRGDFLSSFYRRYEGAPIAQLEPTHGSCSTKQLLPRSFPAGFARVRGTAARPQDPLDHRCARRRRRPLFGPLFDDIICASLGRNGDHFTGRMAELPQSARRAPSCSPTTPMRTVSRSRSRFAYADSASDLAMLEAVGFPVAGQSRVRVWRASHGGSGGTWSTGTRPPAARAHAAIGRSRAPVQALEEAQGMKSSRSSAACPLRPARLAAVLGSGEALAIDRSASSRERHPSSPARTGRSCTPAFRASAARTSPRSTGGPRAISKRSSASPSSRAMRWSPR